MFTCKRGCLKIFTLLNQISRLGNHWHQPIAQVAMKVLIENKLRARYMMVLIYSTRDLRIKNNVDMSPSQELSCDAELWLARLFYKINYGRIRVLYRGFGRMTFFPTEMTALTGTYLCRVTYISYQEIIDIHCWYGTETKQLLSSFWTIYR